MKHEESTVQRGNHQWNCENPSLQSAGGKKGMKRKLDSNLLDALWDSVMALNRAAGPWGNLTLFGPKS